MKPQLPRRRLWRVVIYVASLGLVLTATDLLLVQARRTIHPGYQTTRVIGPTLPDGRIDYFTVTDDHFGHGVTPDNNAALPFLRAWGRAALSPQQPTNGVTDRLGMEPLPDQGAYFVTLADYRKRRNAPPDPEPARETPAGEAATWPPEIGPVAQEPAATWPPKIAPLTRDWVQANERPLSLIVDASRRPRFFIPFYAGNRPDTMMSVYLKHIRPIKESCRALMTRAAMRLEAGDPAGFRQDMLAVHRWARLLAQAHTLVERMMAAEIESSACQVDRAAATTGHLPPADARTFADELARLGDLHSPSDAVDAGERYIVLDTCQWMARGGPANVAVFLDEVLATPRPGGPAWSTRLLTQFLPVPYDDAMRSMNTFYDGAVVAWRQPTWSMRRQAMRLWEQDGDRASRQNPVTAFMTAHWPTIYLLPALTHAMEVQESARAELRLTRVALGLAAYKAERGAYPATLAQLAPTCLPKVPTDPFIDAPFAYAPTPDGYRLYSVGPNMQDDAGTSQAPADDIPASPVPRQTLTTAPTTR